MTAITTMAGLLPIMWSTGTGADVMKRIATPMVGGMMTSVAVVLLVYPAIYYIWKGWRAHRGVNDLRDTCFTPCAHSPGVRAESCPRKNFCRDWLAAPVFPLLEVLRTRLRLGGGSVLCRCRATGAITCLRKNALSPARS